MAKKRVSIYDIAHSLGVSVSTVSRALSDNPSISEALKERVRALALELNYTPNSVAVNLKTGRRNTIGVVVPSIGRSFFSSAIEGIEDQAYKRGYDVLIYQSKDSAVRERRIIESLTGKVDGVIASVAADSTTDHHYYNHLHRMELPLVLFDRMADGVQAGTVIADDHAGASMAVNHLLGQGYRRIYHLAGPSHINIWRERRRGYVDTMVRAGIPPPPEWIIEGPTTEEQGQRAAQQIVERSATDGLPEAIFCAGDYSALGVMLALQESGIEIPHRVAIVGYANEPFCKLLATPLSSVEQFSYRMGQMSCRMLQDRLSGQPQVGIVITPELIVRASSTRQTMSKLISCFNL